jgi:AcrR family transcriptional regulator
MKVTPGAGHDPVPSGEPAGRTPGDGRGEHRTRGDTRARIQQVAVELFTEHGYEATSLREIAEKLDVTKAALYYHFKSKEDIVASLVEDYHAQFDDLIIWGESQPRGAETRQEILRRYIRLVADGGQVFRMLQQNQAAVHSMASEKSRGALFRERMHSLVDLLAEPGSSLQDKIRATMALGGISVSLMFYSDQAKDAGELTAVVADLAAQIIELPAGH